MQRILSPKTEFSNFLKKLDYYYALCSRDYENDNDLLTFSEDSCLGKIRFWIFGPEIFRVIQVIQHHDMNLYMF